MTAYKLPRTATVARRAMDDLALQLRTLATGSGGGALGRSGRGEGLIPIGCGRKIAPQISRHGGGR